MTITALTVPLAAELEQRLARAAEARGTTPAALCEQWIHEGLLRLEAESVEAGAGSGRCSVRTGHCATGPVPLPLQQ